MKDRFKLLRKTLKLKMREMAERLNIDTSSIGKWESGRQVIPDTRIYQICKEFHVRREWLEKGEGEMYEPEKTPPTPEEALREAAYTLFSKLPKEAQEAVYAAMKDLVAEDAKPVRDGAPTRPVPNEILVAMR